MPNEVDPIQAVDTAPRNVRCGDSRKRMALRIHSPHRRPSDYRRTVYDRIVSFGNWPGVTCDIRRVSLNDARAAPTRLLGASVMAAAGRVSH